MTPEEALAHPTWRMGTKNTIDSATMMNKGLEVIEASRLFGMPGERVKIVVHPQSVAHGFVVFNDGSVKSQLAAQHLSSLTRIHVDTDADGVVWLSGVATSQADIDKAKTIARSTEHVVAVESEIRLKTN